MSLQRNLLYKDYLSVFLTSNFFRKFTHIREITSVTEMSKKLDYIECTSPREVPIMMYEFRRIKRISYLIFNYN